MIALTVSPDGVSFAVRVIPRAGRTQMVGVRGDALLIRLAAAPVDGAANAALLDALADALGCAPRALTIVAGHRSRDKVVRVADADVERLRARLDDILGG